MKISEQTQSDYKTARDLFDTRLYELTDPAAREGVKDRSDFAPKPGEADTLRDMIAKIDELLAVH